MIKTLNNKKKNKMFKSSIKTSMNKEELLVTIRKKINKRVLKSFKKR